MERERERERERETESTTGRKADDGRGSKQEWRKHR